MVSDVEEFPCISGLMVFCVASQMGSWLWVFECYYTRCCFYLWFFGRGVYVLLFRFWFDVILDVIFILCCIVLYKKCVLKVKGLSLFVSLSGRRVQGFGCCTCKVGVWCWGVSFYLGVVGVLCSVVDGSWLWAFECLVWVCLSLDFLFFFGRESTCAGVCCFSLDVIVMLYS